MKKLRNLTETEQSQAFAIVLALSGLISSVALLAHDIDLMSAVFVATCVMVIGVISTAIVTLAHKDNELARVVRGMRYTLNAVIAERDELADLLENSRADLRDEVARVRTLSAQVMQDAEQSADYSDLAQTLSALESVHEMVKAERDGLRARVRASEFTRLQVSKSNDKLTAQVQDLEQEIEFLTDSRREWRETAHARGLNAEKLREQVNQLTERVEILQESRDDWRTAYDKLRNGETEFTASVTPVTYTHSASTALLLGTLDKSYEVNGETRYPLA